MIADSEPTADAQSYADTTPAPPRVRLRAPAPRDLEAVRDLAERQGLLCDELELARLLRSDARRRVVLCAVDPAGAVVGIGVIETDPPAVMPSLLLVDAAATEGLGRLLAQALIGRARALAGSSAA